MASFTASNTEAICSNCGEPLDFSHAHAVGKRLKDLSAETVKFAANCVIADALAFHRVLGFRTSPMPVIELLAARVAAHAPAEISFRAARARIFLTALHLWRDGGR